ncbi:MAG: methionine--tRNA ligase [Patescibacteria group bacterium]
MNKFYLPRENKALKPKAKGFYITTSIAYTNAPPHLGYSLELVQADVLARYHKIFGEDVFFLTGTDEHGFKIVRKAEEAGKTPEEFTDELSGKFKDLTKVLNLSNNDFIRTTDKKRHWPNVEMAWKRLQEKNDIYKKKYRGLYCVGCEAFITKKDLVARKCKIHQKEPEVAEEENYFFRLSKYSKEIEGIIKTDEVKIIPDGRKNEMLSFIGQGLEDISFSRPRKDLKWGIPVPDDDSQTIYVWADALVNYISALGGIEGKKFKKYWPPNIQCVGKDILRFHATIWLGMLLALNLKLPKNIFVHGFVTSGDQKMSKSLGNVADPFELVKKYGSTSSPQAGADAVRYFLLREIPAAEDGDFTEGKFIERYNADLAGGIGNLVARVITLSRNLKVKSQKSKLQAKIQKVINETRGDYKKALENFRFNEALIAIWELISFCDKYINDEKPWSFDPARAFGSEAQARRDKEKCNEAIGNLLFAISEIADLIKPFLPATAEKILKQIKEGKSRPLFPRIK